MKSAIVEQIGETGLILPELVQRGLAANERLKYYLTMLQAAAAHARTGERPPPALSAARETCGVSDPAFDDLVSSSRLVAHDAIALCGAERLERLLIDDLQEMLAPLRVAAARDEALARRYEAFVARAQQQTAVIPSFDERPVPLVSIDRLTNLKAGEDSVHRLVMDLHREINRLHAAIASESIDGARVFGLTESDRQLVRAFMKGIHATAHLKFGHVGLATTSVRTGSQLSIQNDLGTTDAHVVVIKVSDLVATLVYTDIHRRRLRFLQTMLEPLRMTWEQSERADGAEYDMTVGRFTASDRAALEAWLTYVGSHLVFLIDWNRARKKLARLVKKKDAVAILEWAAEHNVGHRAFLEAGDLGLIETALEHAAPWRLRYGMRLDDLLGGSGARALVTEILDIASSALSHDYSQQLIQDEVEAALRSAIQATEPDLLDAALEQAALIVALADRVGRVVIRLKAGIDADATRTLELAGQWKARATALIRGDDRSDDAAGDRRIAHLLREADVAIGRLENVSFLLALLPESLDGKGLGVLDELALVETEAVREYTRGLEHLRVVMRTRARRDIDELLVSIDRLSALHEDAVGAARAVITWAVHEVSHAGQIHVLCQIANGLADVTGALVACGQTLHDYVLTPAVAVR